MNVLSVPNPLTDDQISPEEKRYQVKKLIRELRDDIEQVNLLPFERNAYMEQLKVFGRHPENADALFSTEGIKVLTHHSFHTTSPTTSKAALECLANALLAKPSSRQIFVNLGYCERAVARLKKPKKDDELLMSRLLFLTSYGTTLDFEQLITKHHLADHINDNIERHAKNKRPTLHDDAALGETSKLLFTLTHLAPHHATLFNKAIPSLMKIIARRPILCPPLQEPTNLLVNALINLKLSDKKVLSSKELKPCVEQLIAILRTAFQVNEPAQMDQTVTPLLKLLKRIARTAPVAITTYLKTVLLPPSVAAGQPPPPIGSLPHILLQHLTHPVSSSLQDAITAVQLTLVGGDEGVLTTEYAVPVKVGEITTLGIPSSASTSRHASSASRTSSLASTSAHSVEASSFISRSQPSITTAAAAARTSPTRDSDRAHTPTHTATSSQSSSQSHQSATTSTSTTGTSFSSYETQQHQHQPNLSSTSTLATTETEKLMMLFDGLRVTSISSMEDPRMKKATRDLVIELQPEDD